MKNCKLIKNFSFFLIEIIRSLVLAVGFSLLSKGQYCQTAWSEPQINNLYQE